MSMPRQITNLGHGVYAEFDGTKIMLRTGDVGRANIIYLDSGVFHSLLEYAQRVGVSPSPASGNPPSGWVLVPLEPTPEAVAAWWRVKNGHHHHDEPPPADTSDYAAYRALVRVASGDPP
jgi:hypothetical protein